MFKCNAYTVVQGIIINQDFYEHIYLFIKAQWAHDDDCNNNS